METKYYTFLLLATLFLVCGLQCPKDKNDPSNPNTDLQLPPITTEGKNTVGCKIDGKVWIPYSKTSFPTIMASVNQFADWRFGFWGYQIDSPSDQEGTLGFYFGSLNSKDTFFLLTNNKYKNIAYYYITNNLVVNSSNDSQSYVNIIRFDSINQIIAGTFKFTLIDSITNKKYEVTEGRFDLHFAY